MYLLKIIANVVVFLISFLNYSFVNRNVTDFFMSITNAATLLNDFLNHRFFENFYTQDTVYASTVFFSLSNFYDFICFSCLTDLPGTSKTLLSRRARAESFVSFWSYGEVFQLFFFKPLNVMLVWTFQKCFCQIEEIHFHS